MEDVREWKIVYMIMFEPNETGEALEDFNITIEEFVNDLDCLEL